MIKTKRLFNASCLALVVTAFTFAIRANLLGTLAAEFSLSPTEIGEVASAAFWGFTLAMFIGGSLCDYIGMGRLYLFAFAAHMAGLVLTVYASGYWSLFFSTLLVGLGNGFVESASYAMVSSMYTTEKAKKINDWHIWFPAGIMIGGLLAYGMSLVNLHWRWQIGAMILPTLVYGLMFRGLEFPKSERVSMGVTNRQMIRECFRPLFLFMVFCMFLTGATELGTNQWIAELLASVGVPSILLLVFINGIMTIGRANAGFILKRMSTTSLLLASAVLSFAGLIWLAYASGYGSFAAAGVFAVGICFFWPTMIGFVSENLPKTGPLGLSIMGGAGLLSTSLILPIFGSVYENQLNAEQLKLVAGANTLRYAAALPAMLIVAFFILHQYKLRNKAE
jgi:MFS family permease